jgi:hypothetical protein
MLKSYREAIERIRSKTDDELTLQDVKDIQQSLDLIVFMMSNSKQNLDLNDIPNVPREWLIDHSFMDKVYDKLSFGRLTYWQQKSINADEKADMLIDKMFKLELKIKNLEIELSGTQAATYKNAAEQIWKDHMKHSPCSDYDAGFLEGVDRSYKTVMKLADEEQKSAINEKE